jgi:hypothetical protein
MNKLYVANEIQKVLFDKEIRGQISDGAWENARPFAHWQIWSNVEVIVSENGVVGRNFWPAKDNYNLLTLIPFVGDRMVEYGRTIDPNYNLSVLRKDLKALKVAMQNRIQSWQTEIS